MNNIWQKGRALVAIWIGKTVILLLRLWGRSRGSSLPGVVALKIAPRLLAFWAPQVSRRVVVITGTNGKTTTANMIAHILHHQGQQVVHNREGANLLGGIATAFLRQCNLLGRLPRGGYAVLEVDEATVPLLCCQLVPGWLVVNNFFRDQLDRYGELDRTVQLVAKAIKQAAGEIKLILNADDPVVVRLQYLTQRSALYFGLGQHAAVSTRPVGMGESRFCHLCGEELHYNYYHYSQLGDYYCPRCAFRRPQPTVQAEEIRVDDGSINALLRRVDTGEAWPLYLSLPGLYNLSNALGAAAAAFALGVKGDAIVAALADYHPAVGRMEAFTCGAKRVYLGLVKNPTGFNAALTLVEGDAARGRQINLLIAINDLAADGRDVSWLWDVDCERLALCQSYLAKIILTGRRGAEMAVRLKYAGVSEELMVVHDNWTTAVEAVLTASGEQVYLFATYTALWPLEKILSRQAVRVREGKQSYERTHWAPVS